MRSNATIDVRPLGSLVGDASTAGDASINCGGHLDSSHSINCLQFKDLGTQERTSSEHHMTWSVPTVANGQHIFDPQSIAGLPGHINVSSVRRAGVTEFNHTQKAGLHHESSVLKLNHGLTLMTIRPLYQNL